jgi:hypothetical protein
LRFSKTSRSQTWTRSQNLTQTESMATPTAPLTASRHRHNHVSSLVTQSDWTAQPGQPASCDDASFFFNTSHGRVIFSTSHRAHTHAALLISIYPSAAWSRDGSRAPGSKTHFTTQGDIQHYLTYSSSMHLGRRFREWAGEQNKAHEMGAWAFPPLVGS